MSKYIPAEKLKAQIKGLQCEQGFEDGMEERGYQFAIKDILDIIDSLQQEQPMPDSTKLIELWHEDKEMLKEKDFRNDPWRLAYNAFMCGFGRGIAVNKQNQPEVDLEKEYKTWWNSISGKINIEHMMEWYMHETARHFWNKGYNARNEE